MNLKDFPAIQRAINKATVLHAKQVRKGDGLPYIIHPYGVALILSNFTEDTDTIIAGLLHDVLEDVPDYSADDMTVDFGGKITGIVKEVSEEKDPNESKEKRLPWKVRKEKYLKHLEEATTEAMMVSCADKIHNLLSMMSAHEEQGDALWSKFNSPQEDKLWFYGEVLNIVKRRLKNDIVQELEQVYKEAQMKLTVSSK